MSAQARCVVLPGWNQREITLLVIFALASAIIAVDGVCLALHAI